MSRTTSKTSSPKKPRTPKSVKLARPQPPDMLDLARAEIENTQEGRDLIESQKSHWDRMNLAGNVRFEKAEAPLRQCLRDTDLLAAEIRSLEAAYENNERKRTRDAVMLFLVALLVAGIAVVVVGSILYGIVVSKTKK